MNKINIGVSPLTNKIYAGKSRPMPNGKGHIWVGDKQDITDKAVAAVFEWFMAQAKETGHFDITFPKTGYRLSMDEEV